MDSPARDATVFIGIPCYNRLQDLARQALRRRLVEKYTCRFGQSPCIV